MLSVHITGDRRHFGIKKAGRHTRYCTVPTREVINGKSVIEELEFADYDSLEESCRDYAWLITHGAPYRVAWQQYQGVHDLPSLVAAVAASYATDPNYASLVVAIAGQSNVADAITEARQIPANWDI